MHLLVLGAFWPKEDAVNGTLAESLNAPSGAGCFLAGLPHHRKDEHHGVLMHLLVLGAFWQENLMHTKQYIKSLNAPSGAGCFLAW